MANNRKDGKKSLFRLLNKWTLTFAVILVMLAAYLGIEEVSSVGDGEVLYVADTLPYDIEKVSGDANDNAAGDAAGGGSVEVLTDNEPADGSADELDGAAASGGDAAGGTAEAAADELLGEGFQSEPSGNGGGFSINSDSDFFINFRLEREKARSRQLELLQGLIADEKTSAEVLEDAQRQVLAQAAAIERELMLESILVAKYGGDAAVFIEPEKINVVLDIEQEGIADNEAEKIARLVDNYTGIGFENVVIVLKD